MSLASSATPENALPGARDTGTEVHSAWITVVLPALFLWSVYAWINGPSGFEKLLNHGLRDNDDLMRLAQLRDLLHQLVKRLRVRGELGPGNGTTGDDARLRR